MPHDPGRSTPDRVRVRMLRCMAGTGKRPARLAVALGSRRAGGVSLYWKIIVRELRELAWNLGWGWQDRP